MFGSDALFQQQDQLTGGVGLLRSIGSLNLGNPVFFCARPISPRGTCPRTGTVNATGVHDVEAPWGRLSSGKGF